MAVWQENLKRLLKQKEVLILHGNVRDIAYIKKDGTLYLGLTNFIREIGKELGFQRGIFWGVFFDVEGKGYTPFWSMERIETFQGEEKPEIRKINAPEEKLAETVLTRWLKEEIMKIDQKTIFVINYIDKITSYSQRGIYPKDTALLITLIEKIIENIKENNRLIMIALQDAMLPLEYYTNSPKVAIMEIPMPDKEERKIYFSKNNTKFSANQLDLISNITDGLYFKDLENILNAVLEEQKKLPELSATILRKIVNRYRIGSEEDPWSTLPLSGSPKGFIDCAEGWFKERVVGQDYAIKECVKALKKARAGIAGLAAGQETKPKAIFFFAGAPGVGKTFLAKKLAEYLFDTEEAFIRFDMSEFKEEHTISKLIGSPPGYVGYEKGGMLTNAVKSRPFSVVLFDEIEKAHSKIMDIFLQILDAGRLTDSRGQTVFFTECVIIFTSNIGNRTSPINEREKLNEILKEKDEKEREEKVRLHFIESVQNFFRYEISRPELLRRIGSHIIPFNYINIKQTQKKLIDSKVKDIAENFRDKFANQGYRLTFSDEVVDYFLKKHTEQITTFGGGGLVNAIEDELGDRLADQMLYAEMNKKQNVTFNFYISEGELRCRRET